MLRLMGVSFVCRSVIPASFVLDSHNANATNHLRAWLEGQFEYINVEIGSDREPCIHMFGGEEG